MLSSSSIHKPRPLLDAGTFAFWTTFLVVLLFGSLAQAAPIVSNLTAEQRPGTKLVDISYDLDVPAPVKITVEISSDGGQTYFVPAYALSGDVGLNIASGNGKAITWDAGADWPGNLSDQVRFRIVADDLSDGFSYIPEGPFTMGRTSGDTDSNAPSITVNVSRFYIQQKETTKSQWDNVRIWGLTNGYTDLAAGSVKAMDHPVQTVTWWDVVKWCNARSEMEGLTPCYNVSAGVMRMGTTVPNVNWSANGYRLPTEAEWEKAARGAVRGKRFPWGTDTISHMEANFTNNGGEAYARGTINSHPYYNDGFSPYTAPVGSFAANGYGLYDISGNVWEWCWDRHGADYYTTSNWTTDPRGPVSGSTRVVRGGRWSSSAMSARCADRGHYAPDNTSTNFGFRTVRSYYTLGRLSIFSENIEVDARIDQIIAFAAIPDKITTDSVNLTATGGASGNSVTFIVSSGPGLITNNILTFTTSGSVAVTASQAGNANYLAAPDVTRTFTVTKAMAPVTMASLAQTFNGTPRPATATTNPANLAVWFTYAGSSTPPTNAGSYAVVATINDLIYQGSATGTLEIGKAAQAITFAAISDKLTTDSVNLTATGGASGNPVTFTVTSGPGVITNNVLTFTTSGSVTITALQAGNVNYLAAPDVSRTFKVTKATAPVTLASLAQTFDGTPRLATATTDPAELTVEFTYDGAATPPTNAGTYAVVAAINDLIYQGSATGTLEIGKASQAITFAAIPDKLTTDTVNLSATGGASGNPVTFAVTSGPGVITNNVLTFTTSGSVTITASQVGNGNYLAAEPVSRNFSVTKATAPITLASLAQTFDGTPRLATATTEPADLTVEFTYDGAATPPTNAGSYAVVATINDPIYQGSATGMLEIGKASQAITFATIPDKLTTDSVNLTATGGGSANPVTFAVASGPAVIANNVLTFNTSGSVTITASQAGNDNYLAAEDVVRTFNVTKATSTIHLADLLHVDDGTLRHVSFSTDPEALPYDLLYAGSETAPSLPGLYAVTASLEHPIYSGSGSATLTILGLTGRDQRLPSGSSQPQEANGTDFGRVILGRVATQTFTITNPGTAPVALTGSPLVEIIGDHAGDFQVSVAPPAEIPAGGSVSFEVRFAPTQPDARQAVVSVDCDALANGPITFAVGGLGAFPTMLAQTITFNLPASLYLSQGPVPLTATASSGLPVTLTVLSGTATLDEGQLLFTEPGTVKVQATQQGVGNFAAAKPVVRTLTVKADPTGLTLADLTQTYNGTPRPVTVLGTEEEVTVTYFINKLPSDTPPTDAGSYPVTAVAGPVAKKGTLVIARAPLIVQVQDQRKLVGQQNPNLTAEVTGFIGEDNQNTVLFRPISVTTKAKEDSPPGLYPITSSGGAALNYTLIHRPGTLVVEGYVGNFEALLRDPVTDQPVGLLKLLVPTTSQSATASLALTDEAKPLALAGPFELDPETRVATAQLSRIVNKTDTYQLDLTLSLFGELAVEVHKNDQLIAQATDGTRLRDAVKGETVPQMGAYTAVLEPGEDDNAPPAPGWATVKVDAAGRLALTGRLGDGTPFTASLPMDVSEGYRFFVQPYKRAGTHLGGAWSLTAHPEVADTWQARGVELTWVKGDNAKDPGYRDGFGPLTVTLEMDAWQPASKTSPLAQLLGAEQFNVTYEPTDSGSEVNLPSLVALDRSNSLLVLAPVTNPVNLRKWKAKVSPATGAYAGSFELFDLTQKRKVSFSGVLRQEVDAEADGLQGRGHYLLPPLKGATNTETTTGRMEFRRVVD